VQIVDERQDDCHRRARDEPDSLPPPMTTKRLLIAPAALLATFGLAACGDKTIETGSAEKSISDNIEQQGLPKPKSVECPDEIKAEKGGKFSCTLTTADGSKVKVNASQTDDNGRFNFDISQ
jgi:predicted small lipoprotein YifL